MRYLLSFLLLATLLPACKKDDDDKATPAVVTPACESSNYGWIRVRNNHSNPYRFYVDGSLRATVQPYSWTDSLQVPQGNGYDLEAEQVSGFAVFPTVYTGNLNVIRCNAYQFIFP